MIRISLIFFCAFNFQNAKCIGDSYEIILERLETAFGENDKIFSFDTLRIKKFNRTTFVVNGMFTIKQDLGEDIDIHVAGLNFQGGQYKQIMDKTMQNLCKAFYQDNLRGVVEDYQAHTTNPVAWKTCPYPAGSSEVKNYLVKDAGSMLPPYIPGGEKWKVAFMFSRNGVELGGYNVYGILRNNASLLG